QLQVRRKYRSMETQSHILWHVTLFYRIDLNRS
ncbi:MAG: hypothetical protein RL263_1554, partial [Bacteroidota bacterium]